MQALPGIERTAVVDSAPRAVYPLPTVPTLERDPDEPRSVTWRLLDTPPGPGAWNMALDEALAGSVRGGAAPVLRVYRWAPACLSLGRNQPARGRYDEAALRTRGIDVVRRPTGGRAVLHDRELTYSVAVPDGVLGSPRETYAAINRALVAGLRLLGVPARLQAGTGRRAPAPSLSPCFQEPVEGEVVAGGRKLVGSAQRREGGILLQHGSLLLETDQSEVAGLLLRSAAGAEERSASADGHPEDDVDGRPATLAALLGAVPPWKALVAALAAGWEAETGLRLERGEPSAGELRAARAGAERYANPAWTWHL
ncbi:MAG: biotin/lipoate protein ligase [Gemmatimonadetes bacterium]|nr:biotin/lipoate protein ligase [Gemmatimonadota bacterium]